MTESLRYMTKEEIIKYIRDHDVFFKDARMESYSYHELMLIKISIDVERSKQSDYKPMESIMNW
jgi:hypothetical protein